MNSFSRYFSISSNENAAGKLIMLSALVCLLIFIATIPLPRVDGHLVGSDGTKYFSILRSVVFDRDFDFGNDYALLGIERKAVSTGLPHNSFAIGSAILWLPFFLVAHVVSLLISAVGLEVPLNGVSHIYESFALAGTTIYAGIGFYLAFKIAIELTSTRSAAIGTLVIWWASQAIYYIVAEPSMSHGLTIFSNAVFLYVWYPPLPNRTAIDWIKLGAATALVALVRWQEGVVVLLPAVELFYWVMKRQVSLSKAAQYSILFGATLLLGFSPQMAMWNALFGSLVTIPQGSSFISWLSPKPLQTLFSTRHGLLTWHPIYLFALLGLGSLWRRHRGLTFAIACLFLAQLYINSAVNHWWADDAFGGRRFTGLVPWLIIPIASLCAQLRSESLKRLIIHTFVILVLWNGLSFAQYRLGFVSKSDALSMKELTVDRLLLPLQLLRRLIGLLQA